MKDDKEINNNDDENTILKIKSDAQMNVFLSLKRMYLRKQL